MSSGSSGFIISHGFQFGFLEPEFPFLLSASSMLWAMDYKTLQLVGGKCPFKEIATVN